MQIHGTLAHVHPIDNIFCPDLNGSISAGMLTKPLLNNNNNNNNKSSSGRRNLLSYYYNLIVIDTMNIHDTDSETYRPTVTNIFI
jgi:hypothetical protein